MVLTRSMAAVERRKTTEAMWFNKIKSVNTEFEDTILLSPTVKKPVVQIVCINFQVSYTPLLEFNTHIWKKEYEIVNGIVLSYVSLVCQDNIPSFLGCIVWGKNR